LTDFIVIALISVIGGIVLGYFLKNFLVKKQQGSAENLSVRIVEEAKKEGESIKK
jgi:ribonuclease Y